MTTEDRYAQYVTEHTTPPPPTSGKTLHWDGRGAVSQDWRRPEEAVGVSYALGCPLSHPEKPTPGLSLPSPATDWSSKAATTPFYLAPVLLRSTVHDDYPRVTGVVIWVRQEEHTTLLPPYTVCPAMLVHAVSIGLPATYVELRPHFSLEDLCITIWSWCCGP